MLRRNHRSTRLPLGWTALLGLAVVLAAASSTAGAQTPTTTADPARTQAPAPSPSSPSPSPPPPRGTPWPPPTGLTVTAGPGEIVGSDGLFIPPERRVYRATASWDVAQGFTGIYEIQWARPPRGESPANWSSVGSRVASGAPAGKLSATEGITYADWTNARTCFRVRTLAAGVPPPPGTGGPPGIEPGPWAEACTAAAPTSGPSQLVAPPASRMGNVYLAPDVSGDFETLVRFGWTPVPSYTGAYEVERAYVPAQRSGAGPASARSYTAVATVEGGPAQDGWITFEERISYPIMWDSPPCYRVRAVRDNERGPYSAERCAFLPTDVRPPAGRAPLAPAVGGGGASSGAASPGWWAMAGGVLGVGAAGLGWPAFRHGRARRQRRA